MVHDGVMLEDGTTDFIDEVLFLIVLMKLRAAISYYYSLCSLASNEWPLEPPIGVIEAASAVSYSQGCLGVV